MKERPQDNNDRRPHIARWVSLTQERVGEPGSRRKEGQMASMDPSLDSPLTSRQEKGRWSCESDTPLLERYIS